MLRVKEERAAAVRLFNMVHSPVRHQNRGLLPSIIFLATLARDIRLLAGYHAGRRESRAGKIPARAAADFS